MIAKTAERLIVALDYSEPDQAREMIEQLSPLGIGFKIGLELYMAAGTGLVKELASSHRLFLDLKFHDIPNTVAAAVRAAAVCGVWMLNVHAAGGIQMMKAAREALEGFKKRPILLAVTVLTSMSDRDLTDTGISGSVSERVVLLSKLAAECGFDGVICSPLEITAVKEANSASFITVTPGVRPAGEAKGDQARVATPAEVMRAGGDYLVVGRPVTKAADPIQAARMIISEMEGI
jgi:orotidine-5'-phosphate decarboxylase